MRALPGRSLPGLADCIAANLEAAKLTNPEVRFVGVSMDTSRLSESDREAALAAAEAELGVPCVDPVATGIGRIVDSLT